MAVPGRACEVGETAFDTAKRETREEVGLDVRPVVLVGEREHPATGRQIAYVACTAEDGDASLIDEDELAELAWCDWPDLSSKIPTGLYAPVAAYLQSLLHA